MIRRLSVVIWWLGACTAIAAIVFGIRFGLQQYKLYQCSPIFDEKSEYERKRDSEIEREKTTGEDVVRKILETGGKLGVEERAGFQEELDRCKLEQRGPSVIWLMFSALASLLLLTVAYILGGSFLKPPKEVEPI